MEQLDGNTAAGVLGELFPFEMTTAESTCKNCHATGALGSLAAYIHGMGTVVRCPSCDHVLIRVVHARGRYWLDMCGVHVLHIAET